MIPKQITHAIETFKFLQKHLAEQKPLPDRDIDTMQDLIRHVLIHLESSKSEIRGVEAQALENALEKQGIEIMKSLPTQDLKDAFSVIYLAARHRHHELIYKD